MPQATKEARNAYFKAYYQGHKDGINARSVAINSERAA